MEAQLSKAIRVESRGSDIVSNIRNSLLLMLDSTIELAETCKKISGSEMARRWETLGDVSDDNPAQPAALIKDNLSTNESIVRNVSFLAVSAAEVLELPVKKQPKRNEDRLYAAAVAGSSRLKVDAELGEHRHREREEIRIVEDRPTQALVEDLIIQDIVTFFGSEEKVRQYPISRRLEGAEALREAKRRFGSDQRKEKELEFLLKKARRESRYEGPSERYEFVRRTPTYIKVSRKHIDPEALDYYDLRYEEDEVSDRRRGTNLPLTLSSMIRAI
jgi:hypothetical protein